MKKLLNINLNNDYILLTVISLILWGCIGTKYIPLTNINLNENFFININYKIKVFLNNIRYFAPFLMIIFLFYYRNNTQDNLYFKIIIYLIFITFILGNLNLYFFNEDLIKKFQNEEILISNGYLPNILRDIVMSLHFLIVYLILSRLNKSELNLFIKINFIFLIFTTLITLYNAYLEYFLNSKEYLYFTQFLITGELFGVPSIRSLGLGRNLLVIFIPLAIFYFFSEKVKLRFFVILTLIFLAFNIFQLQSRLTIYSYYIFCLVIILVLIYYKKVKKIFTLLLILFLIPQFFNLSVPILKKNFLNNMDNMDNMDKNLNLPKKNLDSLKKKLDLSNSRILSLTPNNRDLVYETENKYVIATEYSSGRLELWRKAIEIFSKNNDYKYKFLGFGNAADRYFVKESISNSIIYALLSGGYGCLIIIFLLYFFILTSVLNYLKNQKKYKNETYFYSLIGIISFIMFRSLVESSFLVFGLDNIILFLCLFSLEKEKAKIKKIS